MMQRSLKTNYLIENATKPIDIEDLQRYIEGKPGPATIEEVDPVELPEQDEESSEMPETSGVPSLGIDLS